ncbi:MULTISPECIES: sensor histidine kinase [Paenibacillus]|uniref:histidine kinase n=1 Tax=Paenibacillus albilobatus TaxID=2716884 RepID=A0A920CAQ1_9BACL|nr:MULTISPECIES: sensor histidine kinase [Paenibacillus]GIO32515.1 sensor histidine kinase [Paenibacillus albilobatus]
MKLFIREHLPLLFFTLVQLLAVLAVFWFDGYDHPLTAMYALFLGLFVFAGYLGLRYATHRGFYARLSRPVASLAESVHRHEPAPLPAALSELLENQYRQYQNMLQSWERKNEQYITFLNQWIHQMKTPLSVIEMITQDAGDERMSSISEEADRLRRGLEMALYAARLGTFEQDFSVDDADLKRLVSEAVHEYRRYFIRSHVYPEVRIDEGISVRTDAKWMRFILEQLLNNAIKYSAGSGQKVTITAKKEQRDVVLEIKDRGVGIPKADLPRVFRPFYTGENGRRFKESTGMGLYIVKEVIDKLQHGIELESAEGQGTLVRIRFR